jgi:ribulose-phosphate 3-epimerase
MRWPQRLPTPGPTTSAFTPTPRAHVHRSIQAIKAAGCKPGLVFNPAMPLDVLDWVIDDIDLILIMSVNPGFGGQSFIDSTCARSKPRASALKPAAKTFAWRWMAASRADNIRAVADAGADTFVAGSAIFGKPDYQAEINAMRAALGDGWPMRR